jgi:hypothetical protein
MAAVAGRAKPAALERAENPAAGHVPVRKAGAKIRPAFLLKVALMRKTVLAALALACGLGSGPSLAQNLQMAEPPSTATPTATPPRGMSMGSVESRYGAPAERFAAVGDPPITRWVYPSFVVYFEHSTVLHAVARRPAGGGS